MKTWTATFDDPAIWGYLSFQQRTNRSRMLPETKDES
jgi:hypothetical protein